MTSDADQQGATPVGPYLDDLFTQDLIDEYEAKIAALERDKERLKKALREAIDEVSGKHHIGGGHWVPQEGYAARWQRVLNGAALEENA